ncbi:MAG: CRISPR-associated protein Csh1 [Bacteroidales bacterium]|nr:CRISPR-associated protein Csh1 [Bacteroidales bacterium]
MIREIINFTNNLIADIPDIMEWKVKPSKGLHVLIELDKEGRWMNKSPQWNIDYTFFYDEKSEPNNLLLELSKLEIYGDRVGTTMNKVLDKEKQIFSCSPYMLKFKKKSFINNKLEGYGYTKIINLLPFYFENARQICLTEENDIQLSKAFEQVCIEVLQQIKNFMMSQIQKNDITVQTSIFDMMKDDFFVIMYLKNISVDKYKEAHENYLKQKLFNDNNYNNDSVITNGTYGLSNFLNGLNSKKPFLEHKSATMYKGVSGRITAQGAVALNNFEILISNKVLPNPLPMVIDRREINKEIISLFNQSNEPIPYRILLTKLFQKKNEKYLSNYYLINYSKTTKGIKINDFDFVPLFRFYIEKNNEIQNIMEAGIVKNKIFELFPNDKIESVFDFERIVVREIFNNSLVKIKDDKYSTNYFGNIDPTYVSGGDIMYQLVLKYRKAFYDFIYKSKQNTIDTIMFDEIMYNSILTNIKNDEIKGRFEWNNTIKKKLNIWFSLYNLFNNKKEIIMASKVTDLMSKMRSVAKGESNFETPEDFAFGAGQIVSYLIDRSAAANKTYAMLEPFLQKSKSNQLQDAIAQTITIYKHDIDVYKGKFERLVSQVLTDDSNVEMKPLLKYFLAGCFCPCVIYESEKK